MLMPQIIGYNYWPIDGLNGDNSSRRIFQALDLIAVTYSWPAICLMSLTHDQISSETRWIIFDRTPRAYSKVGIVCSAIWCALLLSPLLFDLREKKRIITFVKVFWGTVLAVGVGIALFGIGVIVVLSTVDIHVG